MHTLDRDGTSDLREPRRPRGAARRGSPGGRGRPGPWLALLLAGSVLAGAAFQARPEGPPALRSGAAGPRAPAPLKIDFVYRKRPRTPSPPGWLAYDGRPYDRSRGFGWLEPLPPDAGADRGQEATIVLENGVRTTPRLLGRPELASWQGTHRENRPLVFRVDLPDGWYRVTCSSVDPGTPLPLVDQRSFKCRAHDAVFAGPRYGAPLAVGGMTLVEGSAVVEVTGGQLRVVVGDPAYPGWTWRWEGAWHRGWDDWFGRPGLHRYAERWPDKLTRTVDPGFHSLRLNALRIEPVPPPPRAPTIFRDLFDRDDAGDINRGLRAGRWTALPVAGAAAPAVADLYRTSLRLTGPAGGRAGLLLVQSTPSPAEGVIRYATRVSLFMGEGSDADRGLHEAGLLLLADPRRPDELASTFVGVRVEGTGAGAARGGLAVRVGDGGRHQAEATVEASRLPFRLGAGEYELIVEHDVRRGLLSRLVVNGADVTALVPPAARRQPRAAGLFGIRATMDGRAARAALQQFYWSYRVERR